MEEGFIDTICARCGHDEWSHFERLSGYNGVCYDCPDHKKCVGYVPRTLPEPVKTVAVEVTSVVVNQGDSVLLSEGEKNQVPSGIWARLLSGFAKRER